MLAAELVHLSYNMWNDDARPFADQPEHVLHDVSYRPYLRFDDGLWRELARRLAAAGAKVVFLDVGDAVRFASHPEIALPDAWSQRRLHDELAWCRDLGLAVVPKLNFSTAHDTWLGVYGRMVATPTYYRVCRELIAEACELFEGPRFFHLGMDEEEAGHQGRYLFAAMRQGRLWWHDLNFLVDAVEAGGARPVVFADKLWKCGIEEFAANMPRSVVQMNWYYGDWFADDDPQGKQPPWFNRRSLQAFIELEAAGYEQWPAGSNWTFAENLPRLAAWCRERLAPERLLGFCQTPWKPTTERWRDYHFEAVEALAKTLVETPAG